MSEQHNDEAAEIAKEITLEAMKSVTEKVAPTAENAGNVFGKLYKVILKNVREAMHEKKYD